jgi:hypothetical protein
LVPAIVAGFSHQPEVIAGPELVTENSIKISEQKDVWPIRIMRGNRADGGVRRKSGIRNSGTSRHGAS